MRREDIRHLSVQKLYNYELCSDHFEESQFTNKEKKNRLIRTAIPTLFNVPNPPPMVTPARSVRKKLKMTESIDIVHTDQNETSDTPRKKKLKRKLQTLRTKLWRKSHTKKLSNKAELNNLVSQLAGHLPMHTVNFIKRQILLHQSKKTHRRYAVSDKMMALSIFYQSRKAYGILSKLFALPSK